jgi:hypothetical protein
MCDNARGTVDHAACRWARAVVCVIPMDGDVSTLMMWARVAHSSVGALRSVCRTAHTPAKSSLDFARMLRAVMHGEAAGDWDPANLLNARHERTLARLVRRGGLEHAVRRRCAPRLSEFVSTQTFVHVAANLRAVCLELQARHLAEIPDRPCDSADPRLVAIGLPRTRHLSAAVPADKDSAHSVVPATER